MSHGPAYYKIITKIRCLQVCINNLCTMRVFNVKCSMCIQGGREEISQRLHQKKLINKKIFSAIFPRFHVDPLIEHGKLEKKVIHTVIFSTFQKIIFWKNK